MRFLLKLLALLIFGPILLAVALLLVVAGAIAAPILWEELVARFTAPPNRDTTSN